MTEGYKRFLDSVRRKTVAFKEKLVIPTVNSVKKLIKIFQFDMNRVVFQGLNRAMNEIDIVFGPNRDTMEYFIGRVIRNTKLVSLHVNNLVQYNFKYAELESILDETIQYAKAVMQTLPRYYTMLTNVPETMNNLQYDFGVFIFPPQRLAKEGVYCRHQVEMFRNQTESIHTSLGKLHDGVKTWNGQQRQADEIGEILKRLYKKIHHYHLDHIALKEDCLQPFIKTVNEIKKFNESYHEASKIYTSVTYPFSFDEEAANVIGNQRTFKTYAYNYLHHANITKFELQGKLTEDMLNELIARNRDLVQKVKNRLTERLRTRMDSAREDISDWYTTLISRAHSMRSYLFPYFMENRIKNMTIWAEPRAVVHEGRKDVVKYNGKFLLGVVVCLGFSEK